MLAAAAALAIAACGGKSAAKADATTDATVADAGADSGAAGCDPALQDCPAGSRCDFGCEGSTAVLACHAGADGGAVAAPCSATAPCTRGTGCVATTDAGSLCRKYCTVDGDCATGERCHNVSVSLGCAGGQLLNLHLCY